MTKSRKSTRTTRREMRRQRDSRRKQQRYIAIGAIIIAVALIVFLIGWTNRSTPFEITNVSTESPATADGLAWGGPEGAAVTIVDYSDFQCSFCGRHALQTVPQLIARYGDNPNVRYEYRPYVLFTGSQSEDASAAALCAAEQNLFWPYHDTLFANQGAEGAGPFSEENLKAIAEAVGLDMGEFNTCFDSGVQRRTVNEIVQEGRRLEVSSTPTFFINGELLSGAQPAATFIEMIDAALAEAGLS